MKSEKFKAFWEKAKKYVLNKYLIVLFVFLVIFLVDDERGIFSFIHRGSEIRHTEQLLKKTNADIIECENDMKTLQNTDSLERYAREHYYMHAPNEDVYLVEE